MQSFKIRDVILKLKIKTKNSIIAFFGKLRQKMAKTKVT